MRLFSPRPLAALSGLAVAAVLALTPAAASASGSQTFCVHQAGTCPAGSIDEGADLQAALTAAGNVSVSSADPNVVSIGPGTFSLGSQGARYLSANPVRVQGAGAGQTTLVGAPSSSPGYVLEAGGSGPPADVTVSQLAITVETSSQIGLLLSGATGDHVAVTSSAGDVTGVSLRSGMLTHSTISLASPTGVGVLTAQASPYSSEIDDTTIAAGSAGVDVTAATTVHRVAATADTPVLVSSGPLYIDDSLLHARSIGIQVADGSSESSVNALNDTIVGDAGAAAGGWVSSFGSGADLQIVNSIVRGFSAAVLTQRSGSGSATVEAYDDDFATATQGTGITTSSVTAADPQFVDPVHGDYRLSCGSPLIDSSSVTDLGSASSTTDLDRNPRVVTTTTAATPTDLGAYEYQHRRPVASASAGTSVPAVGESVTFDASGSSDPDHGDTLNYAWSFDDGAAASGVTVRHGFATTGDHTATVTVTDPSGLASSRSVTVTVTALPAGPPAGTGSATGSGAGTPTTSPPSGGGSAAAGGSPAATPAKPHRRIAAAVTVGSISAHRDRVLAGLSCRGTSACAPVQITVTAVARSHRAATRLRAATVSVASERRRQITLTLNAGGRRLLERSGSLRVTVRVTRRIGARTVTIRAVQLTLRPALGAAHR